MKKNFKANRIFYFFMKRVKNPHDEIKGSSPSPGAFSKRLVQAIAGK
jgi:hypothetical protein